MALAAADLPVPAQILRTDNTTIDALVSGETLDQIDYVLGEGPQAASSTLKRAQIRQVTYQKPADGDQAKAMGLSARGEHERAGQAFLQAAVTASYWLIREESYVLAAEAYAKANKPDEAIKALADLEAKMPRSTFLPRAYGLRVQLMMAKGDRAGAEAAITALGKFDPARSLVARADLQRADKKPGDAAKTLQGAWGTSIKPGSMDDPSAPNYETIGFQLAADLTAAGDAAGANDVFETLCFAPISKAGQAKAHIALSNALSAANDKATLQKAFDHAIMGGALPGGDRSGGRKAALKIIEKFDKMPDMKDEVAQCRIYVNAL